MEKMSQHIKEIRNDVLVDLLNIKDKGQYFGPAVAPSPENDLSIQLISLLALDQYPPVTVLGIDICKYSAYEVVKQSLIPLVFDMLYNQTISDVKKQLMYMFQFASKENFESQFISTGDGGFQLFGSPVHAILFAALFETNLRSYNSYHCYPKLRAYIGEIRVRYCLTYGILYKYKNNYYGEAVINNSRIMARDKLNRFLIDRKCYDWFMLQMNGIENLSTISLENIKGLIEFKSYDANLIENHTNIIIPKSTPRTGEWIKAVDVQSIGIIGSKESKIDVYNVHIQFGMQIINPSIAGGNTIFTISLGNLNTQGLEPEYNAVSS